MANPYANLPATRFWKTAISDLPMEQVMPIPAKRLRLGPQDLVATAGSCFAQEVGKYISRNTDIRLLMEETPEPDQPYFSALYGNIYTTAQLRQLFDRAYGTFLPETSTWVREDGRFVDAFRPFVLRDGFATPDAVERARAEHLAAVRRVFERCSVMVFTLGLTETWHSVKDGAVFPVAPGVVSQQIDPSEFRFHNADYSDVLEEMRAFMQRLRGVNPAVRVILTVSPVPLTATYTEEHVLVATTHSKSILRAVCSQLVAEDADTYYFPSYEIVTGGYSKGSYFNPNLRTVTPEGVARVMSVFDKTYRDGSASAPAPARPSLRQDPSNDDGPPCDEEEIVRSIGF